mmetsp:Transcript_37059/g.119638  ORF Transcript_37059/g.119638 Transcript_37059/m.119638 type:complete len:324 (+) Transcript_37059:1480-2451(+)
MATPHGMCISMLLLSSPRASHPTGLFARRRLLPLEVRDADRQQLRHLGTELRLSVHPIRGVRLDVGLNQLVLLECLAQQRRRGELGVRARERHARGEVRLAALVVHLVRRPSLHLEPLQKSSVRLGGLLHVRRKRRVEEWAVSLRPLRHFQQRLLELQRLGADRRDVVQRLPVELHVGVLVELREGHGEQFGTPLVDCHLAAGVVLEGEEAGEQRGLEVEDRVVVGHKSVQHQEALGAGGVRGAQPVDLLRAGGGPLLRREGRRWVGLRQGKADEGEGAGRLGDGAGVGRGFGACECGEQARVQRREGDVQLGRRLHLLLRQA